MTLTTAIKLPATTFKCRHFRCMCSCLLELTHITTSWTHTTLTTLQTQLTTVIVREINKVFTAQCYASAVLAMGLCLCSSVTSQCSVEMAERIELIFGMWASFHPSYAVLKATSVISKNKGTSLWNFVLNSGLKKISPRHIDPGNVLST